MIQQFTTRAASACAANPTVSNIPNSTLLASNKKTYLKDGKVLTKAKEKELTVRRTTLSVFGHFSSACRTPEMTIRWPLASLLTFVSNALQL